MVGPFIIPKECKVKFNPQNKYTDLLETSPIRLVDFNWTF